MKLFFKYNEHSQIYNNTNLLDTNIILCTQNSDNINDMHIHYNWPPYDSKVEYLESSNTQYIETGIIPDSNTGIYAKVIYGNNTDTYCLGCRNNSNNTRWSVGHASSGFYYGYAGYQSSNRLTGTMGAEIKLNYLNDKKFTASDINSTSSSTVNLPSLSFTPTYNIRLFGSAGITGNYTKFTGKIYFCKITQGSEIICDLIPVRIGSIGCLFDMVTGNLFYNEGTGNFVLGPDIN